MAMKFLRTLLKLFYGTKRRLVFPAGAYLQPEIDQLMNVVLIGNL
jgi:hypothetical protein